MIKKILLEELENLKLVLSAGHKDFIEGDYNCFLRLAEAVEKHLEDIELKLTKVAGLSIGKQGGKIRIRARKAKEYADLRRAIRTVRSIDKHGYLATFGLPIVSVKGLSLPSFSYKDSV